MRALLKVSLKHITSWEDLKAALKLVPTKEVSIPMREDVAGLALHT